MTKSSPARKARRAHAAELLVVCRCSSCDSYIILQGRMSQAGAHADRDQSVAYAQALAEVKEARHGSRPVMVLDVGPSGEFGKLPRPCDALPS